MSNMVPSSSDVAFGPLYRLGAICALVMVALIPVAAVAFMVAPPPSDARSAFALFEQSRFLGLLSLDLAYMLEIVLAGVVFLAVSIALMRVSPSFVALALFLNVAATAIYFASNPAFEMLTLSHRYAAATTDAQRLAFLSAGEAMLATYSGTAYNASYVMAGLAGLTLAVSMLRSHVFGRVTAYLGIVLGVLAVLPPTVGKVGILVAILYLLSFAVWSILVARKLMHLGRGRPERSPEPLPPRGLREPAPQP